MENKFINVNEAYEYHDLSCWYQNSVDETPPIWTDEHLEELLNDFYIIPKDTPFADVVEVVRCKDCKYIKMTEYGGYCCANDEGVAYDDYCAFGERSEYDE